MDYMYNACSTTARRGALDWAPIFEKTNLPVFEKLYESVKNGTETRKSLEFNGRSTYREDLAKELKEIDEQEIWRAGSLQSLLNSVCVCMADHLQTSLQARLFALSVPTPKTRDSRLHRYHTQKYCDTMLYLIQYHYHLICSVEVVALCRPACDQGPN